MSKRTKEVKQVVAVSQNGHKRAVLYARVSTDEQANNYSPLTQLEACRKYAEQNSLTIVGKQYFDLKTGQVVPTPRNGAIPAYFDDYTGTVPIEQRPEGRKAYALLANGEADALIAYRVDRIVRPPDEGDEWDMPILIRGLAKLGKELHTVNRGRLGTSFAELLIAMLDAKSAGDERRNIVERTRRGKFQKAKSGKVVGLGGRAPYGYRISGTKKNTELVIIKSEAQVVRLMFKLYTVGDGKHGPLAGTAIARRLSEMSIPTPGEARGYARTRGPSMWDNTTVYRILENPTYAGQWSYGKVLGGSGNRTRAPIDQVVVVDVPAIIDKATFQDARDRREYNRKMSKRNTKREYLLRGMVECRCGYRMVGQSAHGKNVYYECKARHKRHPGLEERTCHEKAVRCDVLDYLAWDKFVIDIFTDRATFEQALIDAQAATRKATEPQRAQLETIKAMIAETEAESTRLARVLSQVNGKVAESLKKQADIVNGRYEEQCAKRDKMLRELKQQAAPTDEDVANALQDRDDVITGLHNPTFDDKRRVLERLRVHILVKGHKATVTCSLRITRTFDLRTLA